MTFEVIPAIDVYGGRLARFTPSGPEPVDAEGGAGSDPVAVAAACIAAGARRLHIVDMELAYDGSWGSDGVLGGIVALGVSVQAGGGIAEEAEIAAALAAGAGRVVVGSAALEDPGRVRTIVRRFGDRVAIGIEVDGGRVRARGRRTTDLPLDGAFDVVAWAGAPRIVITAVGRVGTLGGPDIGLITRAVALGPPVVAAGGIGSVGDLVAVRDAGAEGAIVGRAALDGRLDLRAAIRTAEVA